MALELFGFELKKKQPPKEIGVIVAPSNLDGATVIGGNASAYYTHVLDLDASLKNENDLIRRYREASLYPDCDAAIEDIVNEAISAEDESQSVEIVLDDVKLSSGIKNKIKDEFDRVLELLDFEQRGHDIFRIWYVDGRTYYNVVVDPKKPLDGIQSLRYIDPQKIRKVKNVKKKKNEKGVEVVESIEEYFLFNDKGISAGNAQGVKLSTDSVLYCPSGLMDGNTGTVLSHLHKAVKPVNQLSMMEHSLVIYRITRAPERRIFYIDVGNLPKLKAEQYVTDIMNKYRNKIVYDASTGEVKNDKKHMSMMEDFWMPRRGGDKGTEITTLNGGQNLGNIEDVQYFQQKLYQSLNVPLGRLQPSTGFSLGKSSEISREEIKFGKFISRLRKRFSNLFSDALRVQLVSKNIIRLEEWDDIKQHIRYNFVSDNHFTEMKSSEILMNRLANLQIADMFVGKYFSTNWIKKNVLFQTEDEIEENAEEMDGESPTPQDVPTLGATDSVDQDQPMMPSGLPATPPQEDKEVKEARLEVLKSVSQFLQS